MDGAEQLRRDTIPFVPRAQSAGVEPPLQIAMNPFVAGMSGSRMGRPLQTAFGEVIRQIGEQTAVVVVVGSAGTGKSMLVDMAARACVGMGLSVRRIERGDLVQTAFGEKSDVLLVDQTDSISNSSLQTLLSATGKSIATTMVFLCLPSCVSRFSFSGTQAAVVELTPLSLSDARNYLQERATSIGRPNLFASEALDIVIDGSRGLPRLLRSIAQLAFFAAASEGASQIGSNHVSNALASQVMHDSQNADAEVAEKNVRHPDIAPRVSVKTAPDAVVPRVALENHKVDVAQTSNIDATSGINPNRLAEPLIPRATLETHNSIADIAAHVRFATQKRESASSVQVDAQSPRVTPSTTAPIARPSSVQGGAKALTDAPSPRVAPSTTAPMARPNSVQANARALTDAPSPRVAPSTTAPMARPSSVPVGVKALTDAPSPRVTPSTMAPIATSSVAEPTQSASPNLHVPDQQMRPLAAVRAEKLGLREGQWISRSVGIAGALVASFAVAGVISSNLMSGGSTSEKRVPVALAISKPVDLTRAIVQAPLPDKQAVDSALAAQAPDRAQTRDDAIASLIAKIPATADSTGTSKDAATQEVKPDVVTRARVTAPVTNQPTRGTRAAEEVAARKLADDKARAEKAASDHIKSATDQKTAVIEPIQQASRGSEAPEQTAAAQAAERAAQEKAATEKALADRAIAADRAAQEKAAADKAAADRAKAAEVAAIQAQETAKLAQEQEAARQAKAAKDAADKAAKDLADRARAEKVAEEQAKAARQESNRVFSHSLFGFNR